MPNKTLFNEMKFLFYLDLNALVQLPKKLSNEKEGDGSGCMLIFSLFRAGDSKCIIYS